MITLQEVRTDRQLKAFIRFPESLYQDHPYWVPPLRLMERDTLHWKKNPFFRHGQAIYFLAWRDGRIVGRIAAIIHRLEVESTGLRHARFGWLDMIDDLEVTRQLIHAVEDWARREGMTHIKGPLGFTHLDKAGMLIDGFDLLPTMVTLYNFPYYVRHMEALGFGKDVDWVEHRIRMPEEIPDRVRQLSETLATRYQLKRVKLNRRADILQYRDGVFEMIRQAYSSLYDFVPMDKAESDALTMQFLRFLKPEFLSVVLDPNDRVIGFGVTLPSFSQALRRCGGKLFPLGWFYLWRAMQRNDTADLLLIGVADEYRNKGVNALIFQQVMEAFDEAGIQWVETNPELESNTSVQALWRRYDCEHVRTRRAWKKAI